MYKDTYIYIYIIYIERERESYLRVSFQDYSEQWKICFGAWGSEIPRLLGFGYGIQSLGRRVWALRLQFLHLATIFLLSL